MRGNGAQARAEMDRQSRIKLWHHNVSIFIREGQADPMIALLDLLETEPAGNGALRVRDRRFEGTKSVERSDDVEFSGVFCRRVAKRENFQLHNRPPFGLTSTSPSYLNCIPGSCHIPY